MTTEQKSGLKTFCIELAVYAVLVTAYFFLVLHYLGGWLVDLFRHERKLYATVALALIVGQGVVLEALSRALMRPKRSKGRS